MNHNNKPNLLLLTSSFPSSQSDETCGYIRDLARSLSGEFNVRVLAPPDQSAIQWPADAFKLTRSRSVLPQRLDPLQAGEDLNHLVSGSLLEQLAALVSWVCFFLHALVAASRADAVCSHWMVPSGLAGAVICRLLRKPHIVVEHSGALHLLARVRYGSRIARFIVKGSNRIVTVSTDLKGKLVALCPQAEDMVEVIPMGVSLSSVDRDAITSRPSPGTILFIGRLTEIKGLDVLLKAMSGLDDLCLVVAGDGERLADLEALARAIPVNARFIGRIGAPERRRLLSICDAVVIPSRVLNDGRTEGTPVVCLEAMAAGRLVIASSVGGLRDVIADGENGLLFEQGDERMLREKLSLVLSDDRLRLELAGNAQRSAAGFDWSRIGSRYGRLIKSALRENDAIGNRPIQASSIHG